MPFYPKWNIMYSLNTEHILWSSQSLEECSFTCSKNMKGVPVKISLISEVPKDFFNTACGKCIYWKCDIQQMFEW